VFEEAFGELLRQKPAAGHTIDAVRLDELEVLREQRWTLFTYDSGMQRLFGGDFDAFCAAMDNPTLMHQRLEERLRRLTSEQRHASDGVEDEGMSLLPGWDDHAVPARQWEASRPAPRPRTEQPCADCGEVHRAEDGKEPTLDDDPIYNAAFRWVCRTDRWSRRTYFEQRVRDRDLFRVLINAPLVPTKVAFAFPGGRDGDLVGLEVSAIGYRQASIFLSRTIESLLSCYGKHIGRADTVHRLTDDGRELLADIESKLAEIDAEVRHRTETP